GALFSALWTFLLLVWIGANLGVVAALPLSPLYFYLMMYPFWALLSLYALVTLFEIVTARGAVLIRSSAHLWIPAAICLTALAFVALFRASRRTSLKRAARNRAALRRSSKFSSGKSRCVRIKFIAVRSPLSSVQPQVRCASNSSETPNGRSSRG